MYECHLWLHISPSSTPFSTLEMQSSRADSNQEGTGMVKSFAWTTRCSHCSAVNTCGTNCAHSFRFFKLSDRMWWTMVFGIPILSAIILQLAWWSFYKTAAPWAIFSFVFVVPSLPLHSMSSVDFSSVANWLCHWNTISCDTDESPNAFTNILNIFTAINLTLQQNFIVTRCSKFFPTVIYNTSTEHTILQNAHILPPHIDGLTSNLVCRGEGFK